MTALGINVSTQDPVTGWEVLTANHRHYNQAVDAAKAIMQEAWLRFDNAIDGGANWEVLKSLRATANNAERAYFKAWENWQEELAAKLRELDERECRCQNLPDGRAKVCQVCQERASHNEILPEQCYGNTK